MPVPSNRFYIATGTTEYPADFPPLPSVGDDLDQITEALEQLGYKNAVPDFPKNPTRDGLINALENWFRSSERKPDDEVVFYYSGHGHAAVDRHYLALKIGKCASEDIFRAVAEEGVAKRVLIILDTCYSGQASLDVARLLGPFEHGLHEKGRYVTTITSSRSRQEARISAFTPALVKALRNEGRQWGGRNQANIPIYQVMLDLQMPDNWQQPQVVTFPFTKTGLPEFFFPNKRYESDLPQGLDLESQRNAIEHQTHWDRRVSYFTGREAVLARINEWLADKSSDGKAVVVTGGPGTGKSAVLARLVTDGRTNISLHALGKTLSQATEILARAAGVALPEQSEADPKMRAELLALGIARQQRKIVIAVDALDESKQPHEIASTLLAPLVRSDSVRLVIGTRPDSTSEQRFRGLGSATIEIDLEVPTNIGARDMEDYIHLRLASAGEAPQTAYRMDNVLRNQAAKSIAARAGHNFLIAKLTCDRLLRDTRNPAVVRPWEAVQDADAGAEFDAYLRRFNEVPGWSKKKVFDLLEPLAYAQGQGLPWEQLWSSVANSTSGVAYTDSDIRELLTEAAPYLLESIEDERSVYRLFHEAFAEHLRRSAQFKEKHHRMAIALRDSVVRRPNGGPDWLKAHPYVRRYIAIHALEGETLNGLATDPLFLVAAEPPGLKHVLSRCTSEEARRWAAVYSVAAHDLSNDVGDRLSCLHLAARKMREFVFADAIAALPVPRRWITQASIGRQITPHWSLEGHSSAVQSVAVGQRKGRDVIVSGSSDYTVRVWDLDTLAPVGSPLVGHSKQVHTVAMGQRQGRAVIVSGSSDYTVQVWDLDTLEPVGSPLEGHVGLVVSVAVAMRRGGPVIVSGSWDNSVRVWDLENLTPVGILEGHSSAVISVAVGCHEGRSVIVSGGSDRSVRLWDMETFAPVGTLPISPPNRVLCVAMGQYQGRAVIVSGGSDKAVRVWDLETLAPVGDPLKGHSDGVLSVAMGQRQGRTVIVSGGSDKSVRVWDLETLAPVGDPLKGHSEGVQSVAMGQRQGRAMIISASWDRTVRVWDLESFALSDSSLTDYSDTVQSVTVGQRQGRAVIVSGGSDNAVRIWDLETLAPLGESLEGHSDGVQSVALGQRQGRAVIVSASRDKTVRVWDLETLAPVGAALKGHSSSVQSVAVGQRQGLAVIVSGSWDHTVRVWNLESLAPVGAPLEDHSGSVQSVAVGQREGQGVIVSGGDDQTIRIWDLETLSPVGDPLEARSEGVLTVAVGMRQGRAVIVSGSWDRTVRVWDLESLELLGRPLQGHSDRVQSVALGQRQGRAVILSVDDYKTVYEWDLNDLRERTRIVLGTPCHSIVVVDGGFVVATDWGLLRIALL